MPACLQQARGAGGVSVTPLCFQLHNEEDCWAGADGLLVSESKDRGGVERLETGAPQGPPGEGDPPPRALAGRGIVHSPPVLNIVNHGANYVLITARHQHPLSHAALPSVVLVTPPPCNGEIPGPFLSLYLFIKGFYGESGQGVLLPKKKLQLELHKCRH